MSAIDDLAEVEELEIEPLTDAELNGIASSWGDLSTVDSCICCVEGATDLAGLPHSQR